MKLNIYYRTSTLRQWSLLLIASVVFTLMAQAHDNQTLNIKKDYLLIINTYTSDAPWSNAIIEPVQKLLSNERGVATFVEHLNMLIINDTVQFDMLKHAVLDKYSAKAPKAILLLGNPSLLLKDELRNRWGDVPLVLCHKTREKANVVASMQIIGDVKDKNVILIDDMVDTAGTITKAADIMKEAGARSVRAIASHCVMSGPASERVQNSMLEEMVFTDSIPYSNRCAKVKQLSIADMFAETIRRVMTNESISSQYLI